MNILQNTPEGQKELKNSVLTFCNISRPSIKLGTICYGRNYDDLINTLLKKIKDLEDRVEFLESH